MFLVYTFVSKDLLIKILYLIDFLFIFMELRYEYFIFDKHIILLSFIGAFRINIIFFTLIKLLIF